MSHGRRKSDLHATTHTEEAKVLWKPVGSSMSHGPYARTNQKPVPTHIEFLQYENSFRTRQHALWRTVRSPLAEQGVIARRNNLVRLSAWWQQAPRAFNMVKTDLHRTDGTLSRVPFPPRRPRRVCYERTNCCSSLFVVYCPSNTITSVLFNFGIYIKLDFLTSQHWQKNSTSQTSSVFKNNIIISFVTSNYQPYAK